jgi:hypothetical protein
VKFLLVFEVILFVVLLGFFGDVIIGLLSYTICSFVSGIFTLAKSPVFEIIGFEVPLVGKFGFVASLLVFEVI